MNLVQYDSIDRTWVNKIFFAVDEHDVVSSHILNRVIDHAPFIRDFR